MNLETFEKQFASLNFDDIIVIECDHPNHPIGEPVTINKSPALRNIRKNGGEKFICRDCYLQFDKINDQKFDYDEEIDVVCPHPDHIGDKERKIKRNAYYGEEKRPYKQLCRQCAQRMKSPEMDEEERLKLRRKYYEDNPVAKAKMEWRARRKESDPLLQKPPKKISGRRHSQESKEKMSESRRRMLAETGGFTLEHRQNISKRVIEAYKNGFNPKSFHVKGWHFSPKVDGGKVPFRSSYEKKAFIILDGDDNVVSYRYEPIAVEYYNVKSKSISMYLIDLEVTMKDGSEKYVEVKCEKALSGAVTTAKIKAGMEQAAHLGMGYEVWTEMRLFGENYDEKAIRKFSDSIREERNLPSEEEKRQRDKEKTKRHYDRVLSKSKIDVWCDHCQETHKILELVYKKNVAKNGRYICLLENSIKTGKMSNKKSDDVYNPYASEGKKKCTLCEEIKPTEDFGTDRTRRDGLAARCKICRSSQNKQKYHDNKKSRQEI